jgi:hypothetical protein
MGVDWEQGKVGAAVDVPLVMELNSTLKNLRASVAHVDQKLSEGLESLKALMKQNYPGRRTISVSPEKAITCLSAPSFGNSYEIRGSR